MFTGGEEGEVGEGEEMGRGDVEMGGGTSGSVQLRTCIGLNAE